MAVVIEHGSVTDAVMALSARTSKAARAAAAAGHARKTVPANVPCGSCTVCCHGEMIVLHPECGDDPSLYEHDRVATPHGEMLILRHKSNGDCAYLGDSGCTIHDKAPAICREFDCRRWFLKFSGKQRKKMCRDDARMKKLFDAGRKRVSSLGVGR